MNDDLERAALEAIRSAAERLGVDPFRLARFLGNGRIAEFLQGLGRNDSGVEQKDQAATLVHSYLDFLEQEMHHCRGEQDPTSTANGG